MNPEAIMQQLQFLLYDARELLPALHERVALAALQGLSANPSACGSHEDIARSAWKTADAFIAEREKRLKDEAGKEKKP